MTPETPSRACSADARAASATMTTTAHPTATASNRRNTRVIASAFVGAGTTRKTTGATTAPSATMPPSHKLAASIEATMHPRER